MLPHLPALGFGGLSTFGEAHVDATGLDVLNSTLDIIDWRGGRRCHPEAKLVERLASLIDDGRPIGVLAHHLVHDEAAWRLLDAAFAHLRASPAISVMSLDEVRRQMSLVG